MVATPICFTFDSAAVVLAARFAWAKTGKRIAARIAMIAMTTKSSMSVNARLLFTGASNVGVLLVAHVLPWTTRGNYSSIIQQDRASGMQIATSSYTFGTDARSCC